MSQLNIDYENLHRFADQQGIDRNKLLIAVKMCVSVDSAALQAAPAHPVQGKTYNCDQLEHTKIPCPRCEPAQPVNQVLVDALRDATTSLETISRLAGRTHYVGDDGERVETYMGHHDEVRGYAASRAGVARAALAQAQAQPSVEDPRENPYFHNWR